MHIQELIYFVAIYSLVDYCRQIVVMNSRWTEEVWTLESLGSANCGIPWKRTLDSFILFSSLFCQRIATRKQCHLHQRGNKLRSDKFSSPPFAYPEYLQLGMSEAAPGILFHKRELSFSGFKFWIARIFSRRIVESPAIPELSVCATVPQLAPSSAKSIFLSEASLVS